MNLDDISNGSLCVIDTNDSVLLATAIRLKADVLATADMAFQKISEIKVATPSDLTI